jgi:S-(hydroxymethyl)glutathione dehydrogenase/alcohol dehydrogenase
MKAAILAALNAPLVVDDISFPPVLAIGQVLVKVYASGICGKQLGEISGHYGPDKFLPHLLGHEGAGVVQGVGEGVTQVHPGDRVVLHWRKGAGIEAPFPSYSWSGKKIGGGKVTSFNEYAVVSENRLTRVREDIPFDMAALMGCAVTTGLGAVFNDAKLQPGQSLGVMGCGGVGLNVIQAARIVGAGRIVGFDIASEKLELAFDMGASEVSIGTMSMTGLDVIIDTTGLPEMIARAYELVAPGGKVIMVGQPGKGEALVLPDFADRFQGKTLMDSQGGGTEPNRDIPRYLKLYARGLLKLRELITHRFPLDEVNEALEVIRSGKAGRVILEMP